MHHSLITIKNPDGSERLIKPFSESSINPEAEYAASEAARKNALLPSSAVQQPVALAYNQAATSKTTHREAFYRLYVEPVIIGAKMGGSSYLDFIARYMR